MQIFAKYLKVILRLTVQAANRYLTFSTLENSPLWCSRFGKAINRAFCVARV